MNDIVSPDPGSIYSPTPLQLSSSRDHLSDAARRIRAIDNSFPQSVLKQVFSTPITTPIKAQSPSSPTMASLDEIMAAKGLLKLAGVTIPPRQLTTQVPSITVTTPPTPPNSQAGAEQDDSTLNENGKRGPTDEGEQPPAKRPAPAPIDSRTHFRKKYVEVKPLGSGDNGEAIAAILRSDLVDITSKHRDRNSPAFFANVRSKLVAAKFAKVDNLEGDLSNEIEFLSEKFPMRHESFTYHLDSHLDGDCQWLALPYFDGGSLESFVKKFPHDLTISFRWHIMSEMAGALLFLYFGVTDPKLLPEKTPDWSDWPKIVQGDMFTGNTLLGPPAANDMTGFPRCIVADFGRACTIEDIFEMDDTNVGACTMESRRQQAILDINELGKMIMNIHADYLIAKNPCSHSKNLVDLKHWKPDPECAICQKIRHGADQPKGDEETFGIWNGALRYWDAEKETGSDVYFLLMDIVRGANKFKMQTYQPLTAEAKAYLETPHISYQDLRRALGVVNRPIAKPRSRLSKVRGG